MAQDMEKAQDAAATLAAAYNADESAGLLPSLDDARRTDAAVVTAFGGSVPTALIMAIIAAIAITWLRWPERRDPARARRLAGNEKVFGDFDAAALRRAAIEDLDGTITPNAPNEGDGHPGAYVPEKQP